MNLEINNKDFWENKEVIGTQDQQDPITNEYEKHLYNLVLSFFKSKKIKVEAVKVFGCGTGRELLEINNLFQPNYIKASDISSTMIDGCNENIKRWKIDDVVETETIAAEDLLTDRKFDVATIMNNMLTYVPNKKDRMAIFNRCNKLLNEDGVIIGVVHNQVGKLDKTLYFKFRNIFRLFIKGKPGERKSGFKGFKVPAYYFTKKELQNELRKANFKNIDVFSLENYSERMNYKYDRKTGDNNLLFFATK